VRAAADGEGADFPGVNDGGEIETLRSLTGRSSSHQGDLSSAWDDMSSSIGRLHDEPETLSRSAM